ncbi:hypothetical protein FHS48_003677, partial [Novispirillum itersonii]|nr:hypothetical protein [Novispirillum itersonii]
MVDGVKIPTLSGAANGADRLLLERLRTGNTVQAARTPVLEILRGQGGVAPGSPLAAELEARGITRQSSPGLFRNGGLTDADTLVISEHDVLRDNGFPDAGNGYADPQELLEAIGREWAGSPLTTAEDAARSDRLDAPVQELAQMLDRAGLDPKTVTKAEVETLLGQMQQAGDGATVLAQAMNAGVDPDRRVTVVDITGMFDAAGDKKSLKLMLRPLIGERLDTADQGRIARILPKKVDHIAFSVMRTDERRPRRNVGATINSIVDVLEHAVLVESAPNRKTAKKSDIDKYHRFYVPVWDGRAVRTIRIVAEQSKDGIRIDPGAFDIYEFAQEDVGGAAHSHKTSKGQSGQLFASSPHSVTIRQMLTGVKGMDGRVHGHRIWPSIDLANSLDHPDRLRLRRTEMSGRA